MLGHNVRRNGHVMKNGRWTVSCQSSCHAEEQQPNPRTKKDESETQAERLARVFLSWYCAVSVKWLSCFCYYVQTQGSPDTVDMSSVWPPTAYNLMTGVRRHTSFVFVHSSLLIMHQPMIRDKIRGQLQMFLILMCW